MTGVQFGGDEVVKAKEGAGSATLSMAFAGYRYYNSRPFHLTCTDGCSFAEKLIQALQGKTGVTEPSYVYLPGVDGGDEIAKETGCDFFSVPIELGVSISPLTADLNR